MTPTGWSGACVEEGWVLGGHSVSLQLVKVSKGSLKAKLYFKTVANAEQEIWLYQTGGKKVKIQKNIFLKNLLALFDALSILTLLPCAHHQSSCHLHSASCVFSCSVFHILLLQRVVWKRI